MADKPQDAETKPHAKKEAPDLKVVEKPPEVKVIDRILERCVEHRVRQIIELPHPETGEPTQMEKRGLIKEYTRVDAKNPLLPLKGHDPRWEFTLLPTGRGTMPITVILESCNTLDDCFQRGFDIAEGAYEEMEARRKQMADRQRLMQGFRGAPVGNVIKG